MFLVSGSSDKGIKRSINQDSILCIKMDTPKGEVVFVAVCDGMGGLQHGELASATVMYAFRKWVYEELPSMLSDGLKKQAVTECWKRIIEDCNRKILVYGEDGGITLGTTATVCLFAGSEYILANIGDSRAYEIGKKTSQLTHDHTFVQQEVDCGRMTKQEASESRQQNILTKCIGARPDAEPDFFYGKIKKNAVYMFCSDGFRHKIGEQELAIHLNGKNLNSGDQLKQKELCLIELNKERLETDNISVVTVLSKGKKGFWNCGKRTVSFGIAEEIIAADSKNIIS